MNKINKLGILAFTVIVLINACKTRKKIDKAEVVKPKSVCETNNIGYNSHIKSIIDLNCANTCHSAQKKAGGIDFSTYESVMYEAKKARFLGALNHKTPFSPMPKKNPKLSDSTIQVISCWIENGAGL